MYESLITPAETRSPSASGSPAQGDAMERALSLEGVSGPLAEIARSVYQQESGGGRNTKTSNAGARGGMQIIPTTFASVADKDWDINDPVHNARSGVRYLAKLFEQADGDPALTAAGYYGGPGGLEKARQGVAVSDPHNPNAPTTLEYGQQVANRLRSAGGLGRAAPSSEPYYTPVRGRYLSLITPPPEPVSTLDAAKDSAVALGSGLVRGGALVANAFGADNAVAGALNSAADGIDSLESPARKEEKAQRAELIRTAEQSGSTWEEVKAYAGSFAEAPFDTAIGAIGTSAPTLLMAFIPGINKHVATRLIAQGAMGAAQGAGSVKGTIYEDVVHQLVASGATPDEAQKVAAGAQAYDGANAGSIAIGAILGVAAGTTGAEAGLSRIVSGAVGPRAGASLVGRAATGVLKEAPTEGLQGGQEKFASNAALQEEGFQVPTWQGVAGQATLEGLASAPMGSVTGALETRQATVVKPVNAALAQRQAELAPIAARAEQGNSPLSAAAVAGNTGAAAEAEFESQFNEAAAGQPQAAPAVDAQARLAELERISTGSPAVKNPETGAMSPAGQDARLFTTEEKTEYETLKSLKDATEQAAGKTAADPLAERAQAVVSEARAKGVLDALRAEQSPVQVKQFVNDLAIAQSTSARADLREQALARLEYAIEWAGDNPAATVASGIEQTVLPETESLDPAAAPAPAPAADSGPAQAQARELLRGTALTDVDRITLTTNLATAENPALPQATRQAARVAASEVMGRHLAPAATPASANTQAALTAPTSVTPGSPAEALKQADRHEKGAALFQSMGHADLAQEHLLEADLAREEAQVRQAQASQPVAAPAAPAETAGVNVSAPRVATPAGSDPAILRKRRATLAQLISGGLNKVERRNDGNFYLVNDNRRRQFKLDGPADAQLARKAVHDVIAGGAALANLAPTEAQAKAGNYKKGRVEFDGLKLGIENPIGSERKGTAPDGTPWAVTMTAHYGDLTGTTGADGDGVDIYLVASPRAGSPVFVVDQYDGDKFDEHKAILGASTEAQALAIYDAHFSDGSGPSRRQAVTAMSAPEFQAWAQSPAAKKPAGKPAPAAALAANDAGTTGIDIASRVDSVAPESITIRMNGQAHQVKLVQPAAANDDSVQRAGNLRLISPDNAQALTAVGELFGTQVSFFQDAEIGDGFVDPTRAGRIFLNENSSISPLAVFGHEFWHHLKQDMPEVHAAVMQVVGQHLTPDAAHQFRNDYYKADAGPNNNNALNEDEMNEITSDIGGNLMTDGKFWADVFTQVEARTPGKSKGLIAKFAAYLDQLIAQLLASIKQSNFKSTELVSDMEKVRAAFKNGLAQYILANGIGKMGMQAEILKATQEIKQSSRKTADNAAHDRASASAANDSTGGLGRGAAADAGSTPEYGVARAGAVSALGRHYSTAARQTLSGDAFGRGLKGAERERVQHASDKRLRQRINFYIDNGHGVRPEAGVGAYAHEVKLNNLYDPRSRLITGYKDSNAFESAVLDAGFDGYLVPDFTTTQGAAVLLGPLHGAVPVQAIGQPANAPLPADAPATTASRGLLSKELNAIEVDRIPGATLRHGTLTVPVASQAAANDEMARIGSPVRFSSARGADALAHEYAAIEEKYKGTPQWLKAPDGSATKLNERQWVHVRTPAFKQWFGDWEHAYSQGSAWNDAEGAVSKAVGSDGEPLVVYHGSDEAGFTEFKRPGGKDRGDLGIFTTDNKAMAESYVKKGRAKAVDLSTPILNQAALEDQGFEFTELEDGRIELGDPDGYDINGPSATGYRFADMDAAIAAANQAVKPEPAPGVYALFINIREPNESNFEGANWDGARTGQYTILDDNGDQLYAPDGTGIFGEDALDVELARLDTLDISAKAEPADDHYETTDSLIREARRLKNDSAIVREVMDDGGGRSRYSGEPSDVFVAFDPGQLKSADFNNGSYSVSQDDVRFSAPRAKREARDPAIGNRTDVAKLPKGKPVPAAAEIGSLEDSLALARAGNYATGRALKLDLQERVLAAAKEAKVDLSARTQENFKFLVKQVLRDANFSLQSNANAIGWYDSTVSRAMGALATVHPEIESDPRARLAFLWALATTSNGLKVGKNFELAEAAYQGWMRSASDPARRVMPADVGIGNAAGAINKGLELYNTLSTQVGHERLLKFMATEFEVGQIESMLGAKAGGEWMSTPVLGSAVLGPKIGNGFFSNLNGYFDALTIDRWLMRTWGRLTGSLVEVVPADVARWRTGLGHTVSAMNESERKMMAKLVGQPVRKTLTRAELDDLGAGIAKTSIKPDKRELMQATTATDNFRKAGNNLARALDGQKEAPSGPGERNWMRAVFSQVLQEINTGEQAMTMSDLQALLWYPERRLYDAAKSSEEVANGYEDDEAPDYANAALQLALGHGIPESRVQAAMAQAATRGTVQGEPLSEDEKKAMLREFRAAPAQAVQLSFEVAPDPHDKALVARWSELNAKQREAITKKVKDAVLDEVVDAVGAKVGKTVGATGGYAGQINPNLITEYKQTQVTIEQARALAAGLGLALDQDSVALIDPRAAGSVGLVRITLSVKADQHAAALLAAIQAVAPEIDGFTARGNNFDVLNFTGMTNAELNDKIIEALQGLDIEAEVVTSFGDTQSELVEKDTYESHINGLRPDAGSELLGRIERARDRARAIVATEIGSAGQAGLDRAARPGAGRATAARRDAGVQLSPGRDARGAGGDGEPQALDSRPQPGTRGTSLQGLPAEVTVDGQRIRFGGFKPAQDAALAYTQAAGIPYNPPKTYAKVDPARAKRIADAFEAMPHAPNDPLVKRAYQAMIDETANQYQALLDTGLQVEFIDLAKSGDPYGNPRNAILDVTRNKHLWIFPTEDGFGGSESLDIDISGTPMLQPTRFKISGKTALANDLFRAVHDYFGHIAEGVGFRADGEENTWRKHSAMFSPLAQRALTTETRGQNSWLNFGPHAELNRTANGADTQYAPQKVGLLPEWASEEGRHDEIQQSPARQADANKVELRKRVSILKALQKCLG